MSFNPVMIFAIFIIVVSTMISFYVLKRKRDVTRSFIDKTIPQYIPDEGIEIPILNSYSGFKPLAPLTFGGNNITPKLIFFSDHLVYKVIISKRAYYSDIENIRSYSSRFYNKLRFEFKSTPIFFTAIFGNPQALKYVINFLAERGIYPDEKSRSY